MLADNLFVCPIVLMNNKKICQVVFCAVHPAKKEVTSMREEQDLMVLEDGHDVGAVQACCATGTQSAKIR
jgi:hypothetical protein